MSNADATTARGELRGTTARGRLQSNQSEIARRHAANVVLFIYLIIVLDGVVRKYILPDLQRPLVFIRDPFILYLYVSAARHSLIKNSGFLAGFGALLVIEVLISSVKAVDSPDPLLILYGLRQYFSLIFLPFIMASVLR